MRPTPTSTSPRERVRGLRGWRHRYEHGRWRPWRLPTRRRVPRRAALLTLLLLGCGGREAEPAATPAGTLLELDAAALGAEVGENTTVEEAVCGCDSPVDGEEAFALAVRAEVAGEGAPAVVGILVRAEASECALEVEPSGAARHYVVGGERRSVVALALAYRCPEFHGVGVIEIPTDGPPQSRAAGIRCSTP